MSSKLDALRRRLERGERVKEIRDGLELTGEEFAKLLAGRMAHYGAPAKYDRSKVSEMESGERKLTVEEAAVLVELDKRGRSSVWLVFGQRRQHEPRERKVG